MSINAFNFFSKSLEKKVPSKTSLRQFRRFAITFQNAMIFSERRTIVFLNERIYHYYVLKFSAWLFSMFCVEKIKCLLKNYLKKKMYVAMTRFELHDVINPHFVLKSYLIGKSPICTQFLASCFKRAEICVTVFRNN